MLCELVKIELEYHRAAGQTPSPHEYKLRFSNHDTAIDAAFDQVARMLNDEPSLGELANTSTFRPSQAEGASAIANHGGDAKPQPPLPEWIGPHKVLRKLGEGTYGVVYLAHDELAALPVAIKVPSPILLGTNRAREELLRDFRAVRRLRHDGIVRVYNFGEEPDGTCYIVYEYI